jgi:hypothetical protein
MRSQHPGEVRKEKAAWHSAAMAWRTKNLPTGPELNARKAEAAEKQSAAIKKRLATPRSRAESEKQRQGRAAKGALPRGRAAPPATPQRPDLTACEADKRTYYRQVNQMRVEKATTFSQVG